MSILEEQLLLNALNATEIRGFSDDFRWASNFYEIESFEHGGIIYKSVENFYQAMKTLDLNHRKIISELTPGQSKRYTKKAFFILRDDWEDIKDDVMREGLEIKFKQPKMKEILLATRNIYIEETNNWNDTYWGKNLEGFGENKLGIFLMEIRQNLCPENKKKFKY